VITLVVHHFVRDFDAWKPVFDEHEDVRRGHGEIEHRVYRGLHEPLRVIVHNDFPGEEAARAFMADPSLAGAMERAGIEGEPWLGMIVRAERKTYTDGHVGAILVVHHRVRDFDAWKPVFDEHEDVRRGHGQIEHRIYHTLGDRNTVVVHNDFPSEAAALAFRDDPSLPDAMARAGVEGEPGIGLLTCVERKVYAAVPVG
jgi:hypothetical protein